MQRLFVKSHGETIREIEGFDLADLHGEEWLWLDITDPDPQEVFDIGRRFGFDPLSLEDVLEPSQFPKTDDFTDYLFIVTHAIDAQGDRIDTVEIDAFLGRTFLITFHPRPVAGLEWLAAEASTIPALCEGGPDRMLARLTEVIARRFLPLTTGLEQRLAELEDLAIAGHPEVPAAVQALRRDTLELRRVLGPQREVVLSLGRGGHDLVSRQARQRFADAYDLLFRIVETLDGDRGQLAAILDTYRSTVAEKMNEAMKVLTVFAAILLPLSVLAGIYGMNFANMPELALRWGYFGVLGAMAATALGLWIYFSRRGFIGGPRVGRIPQTIVRGLGRSVSGVGTLVTAPMRMVAGALGPRTARDGEHPAQADESAAEP